MKWAHYFKGSSNEKAQSERANDSFSQEAFRVDQVLLSQDSSSNERSLGLLKRKRALVEVRAIGEPFTVGESDASLSMLSPLSVISCYLLTNEALFKEAARFSGSFPFLVFSLGAKAFLSSPSSKFG